MPGWEIINYKEKKALNKIFDEGGVLFAHGYDKLRKNFHVREFESKVAKKFDVKHTLAVTSGTAAIKIGLKALGVKPGDEVITQAFNFIATIEAILDVGAKPILTNIDDTLNMDPKELKKLINKTTKAIVPVHMLGVSANMREIIQIAKKKKIPILEDNCEAFGAKYNNKYLGTLCEIGVASFDFHKTITCGEGGMLFTNNNKLIKYAREYHDHGHENNPKLPRGKDTSTIYGFNYRITEMQGVVGKEQLKKLDLVIKNNKKRYEILNKVLSKDFSIRNSPSKSESIYDTFILFEKNKFLREKIINILKKYKFGTKNLPDAMEWHCAYYWNRALPKQQIKNVIKTKNILSTAIAIPIFLKRSLKDYKTIANKIHNLVN